MVGDLDSNPRDQSNNGLVRALALDALEPFPSDESKLAMQKIDPPLIGFSMRKHGGCGFISAWIAISAHGLNCMQCIQEALRPVSLASADPSIFFADRVIGQCLDNPETFFCTLACQSLGNLVLGAAWSTGPEHGAVISSSFIGAAPAVTCISRDSVK